MRNALIVVFIVACAPRVGAEESFAPEGRVPQDESAYGGLFPYGLRGSPVGYRGVPGGEQRVQAIRAAVAWLVARQTPEGSFDPTNLSWCNGEEKTTAPDGAGKKLYVIGATGMATSAILGAGYTPNGKHPYAKALRRSLAFLTKAQDKNGCLAQRNVQQYLYNHAFALLALVDAYAATGDPKIKAAVQRGVTFTELARNPYMAWRYGVRPGDNDVSMTGCNLLPLAALRKINRAASAVGLLEPVDVPGGAFQGARSFVEKVTDPAYGRVGYLVRGSGSARPSELLDEFPPEKTEAMTAVGMLVRLLAPDPSDKDDARLLELGMQRLSDVMPRWSNEGTRDFYYWYYGALACAALKTDRARAWDEAFVNAVLKNQRTDGGVCLYEGSWDSDTVWGPDGGRIYTTAILTLGLQAPDRMRDIRSGRADLVDALDDPAMEAPLRARVVRAVGRYRAKGAGRALAAAIAHEAEAVRASAVTALADLEDSAATTKLLVKALADSAAAVRQAAAQSLSRVTKIPPGSVPTVLAAMKSGDAPVRANLAWALRASLDDPAVAAAVRVLLKDASPLVKGAAARALWSHQPNPALIPVWTEVLAAKDHPEARAEAAHQLERVGKTAAAVAADSLRQALEDKDPWVRARAATALIAVAGSSRKVVGTLGALLSEPNLRVQIHSLTALAKLGPAAAPATGEVTKRARKGLASIRQLALRALRGIGPKAASAAPAVQYVAKHGPRRLRPAAKQVIAALDLQPTRALKVYVPALDSKDDELVLGAILGLQRVGAAAVPALTPLLDNRSAVKQVGALRVLVTLGSDAFPALNRLLVVLSEGKSAEARALAAATIGAIGPKARSAVTPLINQLNDKSVSVATAAAGALGAVGSDGDDVVKALTNLLGRKGKKGALARLRMAALSSLGKAGASGRTAIPQMMAVALNRDRSYAERKAAYEGLAGLGEWVLPAMKNALLGNDQAKAYVACRVIERVGPAAKALVPELIEYMGAHKAAHRDEAGDALAAIGKPALRPLVKLLKATLASVRRAAVRALGRMGPGAKSYAGAVRRMRRDGDPDVRAAAKEAYALIKPKKR